MRALVIVVAIAAGLTVLLGFFLPVLAPVQYLLLRWAMILAGAAALAGTVNLMAVHVGKIRRWQKNSVISVVLAVALAATFLFGIALGPGHAGMGLLLNAIIVPAEAAFMGLLTVSLLYAAVRLLRRRADVMSIVFLSAAGLTLLGSATLPFGELPVLGTLIRPWLAEVLALGGARGILMGVALGTLTAGLRVLFGVDRPYGGG